MTDIVIITGFLGSGKTSLIQQYVTDYQGNEPVVIVENDFGGGGVDAAALKSLKTIVSELDNGCVCCSLSDNLIENIEKIIKEYRPKKILIEPSGIAVLSDLLLKLNHPRITMLAKIANIICTVDAYRYSMYLENFDEFYENQIKFSDVIVWTHLDLVEEDHNLPLLRDKHIFEKPMDTQVLMRLFDETFHTPKLLVKTNTTMKLRTIQITFPMELKSQQFDDFCSWLFEHYEIVRMKGNIMIDSQCCNIQYNWSQFVLEKTNAAPSSLTVFGHGLDRIIEEYIRQL